MLITIIKTVWRQMWCKHEWKTERLIGSEKSGQIIAILKQCKKCKKDKLSF